MRLVARTVGGICVLVALATTSFALDATIFEGTWIGEQSGNEVVWRFDSDGSLRLDGRPAHWSSRSDSLLVEFEPPDGEGSSSEKAVYHVIASDPSVGYRRLFIYGFDLGQSGLLLTRRVSDDDMARLQSAVKAGQAPGAAPVASQVPPATRSARGSNSQR